MKKHLLRTMLMNIFMVFGAMGALAENWSIDFAALGADYDNNTGVTISSTVATIDGTTMGTCKVAGESLDSRFVLQTGTTWMIGKANGLYHVNSSRRAMGFLGCTKGQTITIVGRGDPIPSTNATLKSHVDNTYTYAVNEDGDVKFTLASDRVFTSVAVEDPSASVLIDAATLIHGDEMSMYYGFYALRDAYDHAVSGDVITLSKGTFASVNITKGVTIRGIGYFYDTKIDDYKGTFIKDSITIDIPSNDPNSFSMEGIGCDDITLLGSFSNPFFNKCNISRINSEGAVNNVSFVNCYIDDYFFSSNSNANFMNCYIWPIKPEEKMNVSFINCLISDLYRGIHYIDSGYFLNCIFYGGYWLSCELKSTNLAQYCVAVNCPNLFDNIQSGNYNKVTTNEKMFVNGYPFGLTDESKIYDLTDEAKSKYLGCDGTEVGLYGGIMPFLSEIPSYPIITKTNIAKRTTNDGKLSVDIEVRAVE